MRWLFGGSAARRLAAGPTLLLGVVPDEQVLDAVRRFDPAAWRRGGTIKVRGVDLDGPVELTAELAGRAALPAGWARAYVAVSTLPWSGARAESLVRGLEYALNGQSHAAGQAVPGGGWIDPVVSVFFEEWVPEERVRAAVAPFIGGLTVDHDPGGGYDLRGDGPISIACSAMSYEPELRPPRLDGRQSMDCAVFVEDEPPVASELLHRAGRIALTVADAVGGVALDVNGFEVRRPEDVHL